MAAIVTIEDNKLIFNKDAQTLLNMKPDARMLITYYQVSPEEHFPVIGRSELFTDASDGNRITKKYTVSYRGKQKDILLEYGSSFLIEPFKKYFKMVPIQAGETDLSEEKADLEKLNNSI